jgi:hypothetical protein
MSLGTAPQAALVLLETEWTESRPGRADVPPIIKHVTGSDDPKLNRGVFALRDREDSRIDHAKHDIIHAYHPEANPPQFTDNGYKEERQVETIQLDISLTDRTDHSRPQGEQRLSARDRMTGLRSDLGSGEGSDYSGILGEVKYILEVVRRGLEEWDTVGTDMVNLYLGNSNANASFVVEMEHIARNTVQ